MAKTNNLKTAPYRPKREGAVDGRDELLSYAGYGTVEWRPNNEFHAELEIVNVSRGRSSVVFNYRDVKTGTIYPLFASSIEDVLRRATVRNGRVSGYWWVVKKGQNYGLELVEPEESRGEA